MLQSYQFHSYLCTIYRYLLFEALFPCPNLSVSFQPYRYNPHKMHHTPVYMEGGCKPTMDCDKEKSLQSTSTHLDVSQSRKHASEVTHCDHFLSTIHSLLHQVISVIEQTCNCGLPLHDNKLANRSKDWPCHSFIFVRMFPKTSVSASSYRNNALLSFCLSTYLFFNPCTLTQDTSFGT